MVGPDFVGLQAHEPLTGQMEVDLFLNLGGGQVVEELQKHGFEQHQGVPGRAAIAGTVAVAGQVGYEGEVHCRRQPPQ
jgi:hypothetical protein